MLCKSCEKENRQKTATILCFDCRQFYCDSCFSFHDNTDFLSIHETVRAEEVPPSFDILIFICSEDGHKGSPLLFLCKNHLELCCKTCKDAKHSNCETKCIQDISADKVSKFVNRHLSKHNLLKEKLVFNVQYLVNSLDTFKTQLSFFIENDEKLFYTLELRRNLKNETINLTRKNAPKSRISILCEQFFSRCMRTCTSGSLRSETEIPHSIPENTSLMTDNPVISFDEGGETTSVEMNLITLVTEPNSE